MSGTLFVIATPLGNLEDLPPRAEAALRRVERIACEDTRRTARLLARFDIHTPTVSCHRFNERARLDPLIAELQAGKELAIVSDGGTPCISDPGALLVRAALEAGIRVSPLPGPSAVTTLLSVSGFPADRYAFEGFLPHRAGERRRRLRELRSETRTIVFFEAPHRIVETLGDLSSIFGDRPIVLGRELTKQYETLLYGSPADVAGRVGTEVRGEITVAVAGAPPGEASGHLEDAAREILERWGRTLREEGGDRRAALRRMARELGMNRSELYRRLVEFGVSPDGN